MPIEIGSTATPDTKAGWYHWDVFLTGSDEELDQVQKVEYRLHSSFRNPVRIVSTRETAFMLRSAGWGEFVMQVVITYKDGRQETRPFQLRLR